MIRSKWSIFFCASLAVVVCADAFGTPQEPQRYPFDPACAWGRIANGRGLIVRCLSKEESERLARGAAPAASGVQSPGPSSQVSGTTVAAQTAASPVASSQPSPPASTSGSVSPAPSTSASSGLAAPSTPESYLAELVSVTADDGELPLAKKKLSAPLDRYAKCVADFGGLTAATGQVEVRFLVRERGRAEGASAEKYQGMTEAAAACIAQVVDRRPTGAPEAPVVGATALIRVRKKPAK